MPSLPLLFNKIRNNGILWLYNRLRVEIRNPSHIFVRLPIDLFLRFRKRIFRSFKGYVANEWLYLIYDLEICDLTYGFIFSLLEAESEAKKQGKIGFVVVIVSSFWYTTKPIQFCRV